MFSSFSSSVSVRVSVVLVLYHTENGNFDSLFTHKLLYDGSMSLAAVEQYEIRAFAHRAVFLSDVREPALI